MRFFLFLFFLFVAVPWLEIVILLKVSQTLGVWRTVAVIVATGAIGAALARRQGARAWRDVRVALHQGRAPSKELFDGFCILCAGLLLVTPGLLTDGAGFLLLTPPIRRVVRRALARRLVGTSGFTVYRKRSTADDGRFRSSDNGEFIEVDVDKVELEEDDV